MKNLTAMPLADFAGLSYPCQCGRTHTVSIQKILVENGCLAQLPQTVQELGGGPAYLLADPNTYAAAAEKAGDLLTAAGIPFHGQLYRTQAPLVPNEHTLGEALANLEPSDKLIIAVGSGTLNDTARFLSARTGIPYMVVCTAPSMDGYASTVCPLILDGQKITKPGVYPQAILADTDILKEAPMPMLTAGFGDIIGKYTALADWRLSQILNGEYYCEACAQLMAHAVEKCAQNAPGLKARDPQAIQYVTEALILSGITMGMVGNSRPASGAEHHFSHYWEVDALRWGQPHPLHGNSVGVGAVLSASLYQLAQSRLPQGFPLPDKGHILRCLTAAGSPTGPQELGIRQDLFYESILHAMEIRDRFTILRFLDREGLLGGCAAELAPRFYPAGKE